MHYSYPVIITKLDDVVVAEVPDLGLITNGQDYDQAVEMARTAVRNKVVAGPPRRKIVSLMVAKRKSVFYDKNKSIIEEIKLDA